MDSEKKGDNIISRILKQVYNNTLILLILITLGIVSLILSIQIRIGVPYWDVFNYLNNALYFAGMNGGGVSILLPPLIPFITSLIFRMGYVSVNAIFMVSGLISIIGIIGFYFLLKQRFNAIQSFAGSIIFISLPVVLSWVVSGGIDIPGIAFSIWAIYFMIIGLKDNSKFLYLVLPLFVIATLCRYTSGLIILPILLYLLINLKDLKHIQNFKIVISGILIEFGVLMAGVLYFFMKLGVTASIFDMIFAVATAASTGTSDVAYNPNTLYYLQNLLNYISVGPLTGTYQHILNPSLGVPSILSYLIAFISIVGISFYIYNGAKSKFNGVTVTALKRTDLLKSILILGLVVGFIISFYYKSLVISEILLISLLYTLYKFIFDGASTDSGSKVGLDFLFLSWFGSFLIFHGILSFKVDRYFITMAPAFAYFIILGFSEFLKIIDRLKPTIKKSSLRRCGVYLIFALLLLSTATATYIGHTPKKTFTVDIDSSSNWIKEYDPQYPNKNIRSDYPNAVSWYLKMEVLGAYPRLFNTTSEFADYLKNNEVDYYIDSTSKSHPNIEGYNIIKSFGVVAIYQRE
nr:glycosyltransferase family 39 protein [uncultured Methanobacterium sp.]